MVGSYQLQYGYTCLTMVKGIMEFNGMGRAKISLRKISSRRCEWDKGIAAFSKSKVNASTEDNCTEIQKRKLNSIHTFVCCTPPSFEICINVSVIEGQIRGRSDFKTLYNEAKRMGSKQPKLFQLHETLGAGKLYGSAGVPTPQGKSLRGVFARLLWDDLLQCISCLRFTRHFGGNASWEMEAQTFLREYILVDLVFSEITVRMKGLHFWVQDERCKPLGKRWSLGC